MDIQFFDDEEVRNLRPLNFIKMTEELRCGVLTLEEKAGLLFSRTRSPFTLLLNSRLIAGPDLAKEIAVRKHEHVFTSNGRIVAALIRKKDIAFSRTSAIQFFNSSVIHRREIRASLVSYPWDIIHKNAEEIKNDIALLRPKRSLNKDIYIGKDCKIKPGVVLDPEDGPIFIDDGAKILANSVIMGPCYIGKGTTIKAIAKIYGGTSIGPMCKVGGEVEGSIFQGYSNKQHDGFLGHSYICEWVNLGADTNNSDLKNNYSNVKVYMNGKMIDSGIMFVGLMMGDHSKAGINTMFNTGTVVGVSSNVFGAGFPPKFIPSFSWGGAEKMVEYDIEKAIQTAKAVMKRRRFVMTIDYENKLRSVFAETAQERK
ncbi:MAG: putative sugar nucleotidyl transferase [Candidatus Saganbacteria bacterium]|nr:putative sugar nucleotidyl transferase [Candidatus Saganbacteria bacterium]